MRWRSSGKNRWAAGGDLRAVAIPVQAQGAVLESGLETKRFSVCAPSGATSAAICSSRGPVPSTCPKTMRPTGQPGGRCLWRESP